MNGPIKMGWQPIITIPVTPTPNALNPNPAPVNMDLLTQYGQITLGDIQAHAMTYIGQPIRNNQLSLQLYDCLSNPVSKDVQERMVTERPTYKFP